MSKPSSLRSGGMTAYDALLQAIRDGVFQPGDRLREEDVAQRFDLSRTPVREALRRLEADGVVEHRARVGAVIRQLDATELVELYEMRMVLERTAAELAARHGLAAEFDTLEALNADIMQARGTPSRAAALNQSFHRALYRAARNRFLLESARAINNALLLMGPTTFADAERLEDVIGQHAEIVAALRAGDVPRAGAAAEAHLQSSLRYRLKALHG